MSIFVTAIRRSGQLAALSVTLVATACGSRSGLDLDDPAAGVPWASAADAAGPPVPPAGLAGMCTGSSALTCESGALASENTGSFNAEISVISPNPAGGCNAPVFLTGSVGVGGACTQGTDCAPTCCSCPPGTPAAGMTMLIAGCSADSTCFQGCEICCSPYALAACGAP
jgi:hypothetical protein